MKENLNEYQKPSILESLDEHNQRIIAKNSVQKSNGIMCPTCGKELFDTNSNMSLSTHPAKYAINCHNCTYIGFRY